MQVRHVPFGDALGMAERGEIADAKSVVGMLLADRRAAPRQRRTAVTRSVVDSRDRHDRAAALRRGVPVVDAHREGTFGEHARRLPAGPARLRRLARRPRQPTSSASMPGAADRVRQRPAGGAARRPSTIARQLAALRMLHRYLAVEGVRSDDPTADLEGVRVPAGLPKPLTEDEVDRASSASAQPTTPVGRRDLALLELLYATGARISEATGLSDRRHRRRRATGAAVRQGSEGTDRAVRVVSSRCPRATGSPRTAGPRWYRSDGAGATMPKRCSSTPAAVG